MAEESGRPGTCRSKVGCEAIDEPCTNRMVPMLFAGSPAHFSHMNSFTPPSLLVQCSAPVIGVVISFIAHPCVAQQTRLEMYRFPTAVGAKILSPKALASAVMRVSRACPAASFSGRMRAGLPLFAGRSPRSGRRDASHPYRVQRHAREAAARMAKTLTTPAASGTEYDEALARTLTARKRSPSATRPAPNSRHPPSSAPGRDNHARRA